MASLKFKGRGKWLSLCLEGTGSMPRPQELFLSLGGPITPLTPPPKAPPKCSPDSEWEMYMLSMIVSFLSRW